MKILFLILKNNSIAFRLALSNGDLNVRKSLKTQFTLNGGAAPRKTLMHKMSENMNDLNDSKENVGFQNSQFNLKTIEEDSTQEKHSWMICVHSVYLNFIFAGAKNHTSSSYCYSF